MNGDWHNQDCSVPEAVNVNDAILKTSGAPEYSPMYNTSFKAVTNLVHIKRDWEEWQLNTAIAGGHVTCLLGSQCPWC
jgi:hypothetical protein